MKRLFTTSILIGWVSLSFGQMYSTYPRGGEYGAGSIVVTDDNGIFQKEVEFPFVGCTKPGTVNLLETSPNVFIGTTTSDYRYYGGGIFEYDANTNTLRDLFFFDQNGVNGYTPLTGLVEGPSGRYFGVTKAGGSNNNGVLYEFLPGTDTVNVIHNFNAATDGNWCVGEPYYASNGKFYGFTYEGGAYGTGTIYSYDLQSNTFTKLADLDLNTHGRDSRGSKFVEVNGKLYATLGAGGAYGGGTIVEYDYSTNNLTVLYEFDGTTVISPEAFIYNSGNSMFYGLTELGGNNGMGVLYSFDLNAQSIAALHHFDGQGGNRGKRVMLHNNNLYGVTQKGGSVDCGVLFKFEINTNIFTKLQDINLLGDVKFPYGAPIVASNGKMYGSITSSAYGNGGIYSYDFATSSGNLEGRFKYGVLGVNPVGKLTQISVDEFVGLTNGHGPDMNSYNSNLFKYNRVTDEIIVLKSFYYGGGMTYPQPVYNAGYIYGLLYDLTGQYIYSLELATNSFQILYEFDTATCNGTGVTGALIMDGTKLYGITSAGATASSINGVVFAYDISTNTIETLKEFDNSGLDGEYPSPILVLSDNGKLYGTGSYGGTNGDGTLWEIDLNNNNAFTKLADLDADFSGGGLEGGVVLAPNGKLYGASNYTTTGGGALYEWDIATATGNVSAVFDSVTGIYPYFSALNIGPNGDLFVITYQEAAHDQGAIVSFDLASGTMSPTYAFPANGVINCHPEYLGLINYDHSFLSHKELAPDVAFRVYPNPTNDIVTISSETQLKEIRVYGLDGSIMLVHNVVGTTAEISLAQLPVGVYLFKIVDVEGNHEVHRVFIK